ncbi:hypothetical protein TVAG_048260 [Trichomonas vaginalis G3]|uniref:Uncharacterized protein n=1 Tax=Trichomonas vaginalis (strain ATCC PRA-98 / G3) TaxID=412133 RepID=A2FCQ0_TRIV3|nr:hypothetical protein TVAGG3_0287490 [Trichomonas vaginalis G3]EAX97325.1 hypothetical protein TVAG_048260 [Trichomonas vaginalis G3]KAI5527005.1 hypothetical protein TVAGG3_0287490 [Trichomonas vaginalis G3]|eukprot:XP_001310255.1 hypothetical protein [Trichomonas vaginalis G3]
MERSHLAPLGGMKLSKSVNNSCEFIGKLRETELEDSLNESIILSSVVQRKIMRSHSYDDSKDFVKNAAQKISNNLDLTPKRFRKRKSTNTVPTAKFTKMVNELKLHKSKYDSAKSSMRALSDLYFDNGYQTSLCVPLSSTVSALDKLLG